MSDALWYGLGISFTLAGQWLQSVSNISLKLLDNEQDEREKLGKELLPCVNKWCLIRYGTLVLGASMVFLGLYWLPMAIWTALSPSGFIFYNIMAHYFLNDPLEREEAYVLAFITVAVTCIGFSGPGPADDDEENAIDDIQTPQVTMTVIGFPIIFIIFIVFFYIQRTTLAYVKSNPELYPPGWMPNPLTVYNLSGPIVSAIFTMLGQFSVKLAVSSTDPVEPIVILPACLVLIFYPLMLWSQSFMANELHAVSCIPTGGLSTMLINSYFAYACFEDEPQIVSKCFSG